MSDPAIFTDSEREALINPDVREIQIGKKSIRTITIYPMSLADQLEMSEIIVSLVQGFMSLGEDTSDSDFIQLVMESVKSNFISILTSITEEDANTLLKEITNNQAYAIGLAVYQMNYEFLKKSASPWIEKLKQSRLANLLQPSADTTPSTISPISTEETSETED